VKRISDDLVLLDDIIEWAQNDVFFDSDLLESKKAWYHLFRQALHRLAGPGQLHPSLSRWTAAGMSRKIRVQSREIKRLTKEIESLRRC